MPWVRLVKKKPKDASGSDEAVSVTSLFEATALPVATSSPDAPVEFATAGAQ